MTTSLQRRRLTVAGVASRRIRVPVRCSIARSYLGCARSSAVAARGRRVAAALCDAVGCRIAGSPAGFLVWWIQGEYLAQSAAFVRGTCTRSVALDRRRGQLERAAAAHPAGADAAVRCAAAVVPGPDHQ